MQYYFIIKNEALKDIFKEIRSGIPSERIVIGGFSMGGALALYAGLTYDKPLGGILGLSSFLIRKDKIPQVGFYMVFLLLQNYMFHFFLVCKFFVGL